MNVRNAFTSPERMRECAAQWYDLNVSILRARDIIKRGIPKWVFKWHVLESHKQHRFKFVVLQYADTMTPTPRPERVDHPDYPLTDSCRVLYQVPPTGVVIGGFEASPWQENAIRILEDLRSEP